MKHSIIFSLLLVDLYSLSVSHPEYYSGDGVHFTKEGIEAEAGAVTTGLLKLMGN